MLAGMGLLLDSFWRALAYCLQPRVILLSLLPLVLVVSVTAGLFWLYWDDALLGLRAWLSDWALLDSLFRWLESVSLGHLRTVLDPLLLIMLVLPLVILLSLLAVAWLVTPRWSSGWRRAASRSWPRPGRQLLGQCGPEPGFVPAGLAGAGADHAVVADSAAGDGAAAADLGLADLPRHGL